MPGKRIKVNRTLVFGDTSKDDIHDNTISIAQSDAISVNDRWKKGKWNFLMFTRYIKHYRDRIDTRSGEVVHNTHGQGK